MNEKIDRFIEKHRVWELEKYPPLPLSSACAPFNQKKVSVLSIPFETGRPIKITVNLYSSLTEGSSFHYHDFFELVYVYRSECMHRFPKGEIFLKEHDILLLNPNTIHVPFSTSEDVCMFNILISKSLFEESLFPAMSNRKLLSGFVFDCLYQTSRASDYLYFPADEGRQTGTIVEEMIVEYLTKDLLYEQSMNALLNLLFTRLSRTYNERHDVSSEFGKPGEVIADVLAYMNENSPTVSLEELSDRFGYSARHLSRLIRHHTGKSYADIVQRLKLERARRYLEAGNEPILTIMERVGFHSAYHFYSVFKEHYLMTPAEYRKNARKE
ncbi:MAG: AraC family transcriptional regulator [Clostridiales bacterium]|nr:AraC family transcriptional regulator [Clostridiales bacterium]